MLKSLSKIFAVATLGFFGSPAVEAQTNVRAPEEHVAVLDTNGLSALRAEFSRTALGQDLLEMADDYGATIGFDSLMRRAGEYAPPTKTLSLQKYLSETEKILVLAHELKHVWHEKMLHVSDWENSALMPSQLFTLLHYQEADAYAFSAYFWADRMKNLKQNPDQIDPGYAIADFIAARMVLDKIEADSIPLPEYRFDILLPVFWRLPDLGYVDTHLGRAYDYTMTVKTVADTAEFCLARGDTTEAEKFLSLARGFFEGAPADHDVTDLLRHFGNVSMDPAAETALDYVAAVPADSLYAYPLRMPMLTASLVTQTTLRTFDEVFKESRDKVYQLSASIRAARRGL